MAKRNNNLNSFLVREKLLVKRRKETISRNKQKINSFYLEKLVGKLQNQYGNTKYVI